VSTPRQIFGVTGGLRARCQFPLPFPENGGRLALRPNSASSKHTFMKIQFHIRGLNVSANSRRWLEQSLGRLQSLTAISAAAVVLEYERSNAPAFRAFALLAVPGPDIHAEARDHTLEAAWLKVVTALRKQIEQRKSRQEVRAKRNGHLRTQGIRRTRSVAGFHA